MLSHDARLRSRADFSEVVRRGRRVSRPLLTVHALLAATDRVAAASQSAPPRAGLVVSKAVGGSVVRHRTARRLRHLLRDRLATVPAGARLVVRAAPAAGEAPSAALAADLDAALTSALRPRGPK
ncbi:MAG: ribonuclease P protein component [Actinomycetota bacterium]|nr:ribonuclease P protein component [Actinomycetota bacterium]